MQSQKNPTHSNYKNMTTAELKALLKSLETQNDQLEVKNDELTNSINDMREVIKKVNDDQQQQLQYERQRQKKLKDEIERSKAALKASHQNNFYANMLAFDK